MSTSPSRTSDENRAPSGTTRRTVIRTVGHAAWAGPVIVAATAAPALAATGPAKLSVTVTTANGYGITFLGHAIDVNSTITNSNTLGSTDLKVTITVTLTDANEWGNNPSITINGYTRDSGPTGSGVTRTWVYDATAQIGGAATGTTSKSFNCTVNVNSILNFSTLPQGTVTITAAPGGTGTSGSGAKTIT